MPQHQAHLKNIKIDEDLHRQLRLTAIHSNLTIQDTISMIVKQYYTSRNKD